jgi:hypothetical protein
MIYIDNYEGNYKNMVMCHLISDKNNRKELLAFGKKIGLKEEWLQENTFLHFDISKSKRKEAIEAGAKEISCLDLGKIIISYYKKRKKCTT